MPASTSTPRRGADDGKAGAQSNGCDQERHRERAESHRRDQGALHRTEHATHHRVRHCALHDRVGIDVDEGVAEADQRPSRRPQRRRSARPRPRGAAAPRTERRDRSRSASRPRCARTSATSPPTSPPIPRRRRGTRPPTARCRAWSRPIVTTKTADAPATTHWAQKSPIIRRRFRSPRIARKPALACRMNLSVSGTPLVSPVARPSPTGARGRRPPTRETRPR